MVPGSGPVSDATWMPLHEAVAWALYRGNPPPPDIGLIGDGLDIEYEVETIDNVRKALSSGRVKTTGQRGYEPPEPLPAEHWLPQFGQTVTTVRHMYAPFRIVLAKRADVMREWPAVGSATRGRPIEHNWSLIRGLAEAGIRSRPDVSRTALAASLEVEYRSAIEPATTKLHRRTIAKKLSEWGLAAEA